MNRPRLEDVFTIGDRYNIVTKYKEIPVRVNLRLNWLDEEGRLLGFDWGRTHLKVAFSTLDPVYVELSPEEFAKTQVFSNLGKELVLMLENFVEPPEFVKRRYVRVEPDENKPVKVVISVSGISAETQARDISETGVGVALDRESHRELIDLLEGISEDLKAGGPDRDFTIRILLPSGEEAVGKGRLRNVIGLGRDVYVRLGFEVSFPKKEITKIKRYVLERQKEIIKSLRMV
ncbi:MAG: PilZ domain-containing protein [Aquificota bacterium]|nr:PilZ domain-containing protein [Aquificota bacterium]